MHYQSKMEAFFAGVQKLIPLVPGVIPFGLVTGVMAIDMGMSPSTTMGMTLLFYSGSAQMAALQLLRSDAFSLSIVLTALVINLRFLMYSASLAPYLHHLPRRWKWSLSYLLSDQSYALSIMKFSTNEINGFRHYFYAGTAISMWLSWQLSVLAGISLGASIPSSWSLDFAIPLAFLALLVPAIRNTATFLAALAGGLVAVLAATFPYNLGLVTASICGILIGLLFEKNRKTITSKEALVKVGEEYK